MTSKIMRHRKRSWIVDGENGTWYILTKPRLTHLARLSLDATITKVEKLKKSKKDKDHKEAEEELEMAKCR
jgi:hypothetical protein